MTNETKQRQQVEHPQLNRALVVISPDLIKPSAPKDSTLVTRAIALAKATGCELEFFHVTYDGSLSSGFFSDDDDVRREQEKRVDEDATLMAELVLRLGTEGVTIKHDTRWDSPRTDAILRKINESQPDLVMKQSREHGYVMGLFGNTDWDLIRQSPAHLWFVNDGGTGRVENLVTAVGASKDDDEILAGADYDVFRMANLIADGFGAKNTPVHAYQAPLGLSTYAAYAPEFGGVTYPPSSVANAMPTAEEVRQQIARKHGRSIEAFAEYFHIEPERVRVAEGHPHDVLAAAASDIAADVIVMAARNMSRWERWSKTLTAEPVLADAPCDVVIVKDAREASIPDAEKRPVTGIPVYDLEKAVMEPARAFDSPSSLAQASEISIPLRNRIFEIWKQDIRAQMAEEDEGGLIGVTHADSLRAINVAQTKLVESAGEHADAQLH
jgi:nucleotide-binding universal stress UspA family protein